MAAARGLRSVSLTVARRPDLAAMAAEIKRSMQPTYQRIATQLQDKVSQVIRSQGASVGTEWGNRTKWAGGAPALIPLVGRFTIRVTAERFSLIATDPHASILQYGGRAKNSGKRFAIPFPGVSGKPGDYKATFVRPGAKAGTFVVMQRAGDTLKPLFILTPQVVFPRRLFLSWFSEFRRVAEDEIERTLDEIAARVIERHA